MSRSTSKFTQLTSGQASKEPTVNELFNAVSPASFGARKQSSSGLSWDYMGGDIFVDGTLTEVASGTITLTASATNYIEADRAGAISKNTSGFTAGRVPLYSVVTGTATVTSYIDYRRHWPIDGHASITMTDANKTLSAIESACAAIVLSGGLLTVTRDVIAPLTKGLAYDVTNTTTGLITPQSIRVIGSSGTGVTIANGMTARVRCDGTNYYRVTADV